MMYFGVVRCGLSCGMVCGVLLCGGVGGDDRDGRFLLR